MHVVFRAADRDGNHFIILANARDVGPEPRLHFAQDCIATLLGAENQMDVIPGE
jgi:hypothetical protein